VFNIPITKAGFMVNFDFLGGVKIFGKIPLAEPNRSASKTPCYIHLKDVILSELNFWQSPANQCAAQGRKRDALCRWM
jgi:hypothetical protein